MSRLALEVGGVGGSLYQNATMVRRKLKTAGMAYTHNCIHIHNTRYHNSNSHRMLTIMGSLFAEVTIYGEATCTTARPTGFAAARKHIMMIQQSLLKPEFQWRSLV